MENNMKTILVFDADQKHSLGIVRCLGKLGYTIYVLSNKKNSLSSWSKYCSKELVVKNDLNYKKNLIKVINKEKIDILMPVGTNSFVTCNNLRKEINEETKALVLLPPKESFAIAMSKEKTLNFADEHGITIPITIYPNENSNIKRLANKIGNELVIKAKKELGINVVDYTDIKNIEKKYQKIVDKFRFSDEELPIIQNYIGGEGRGYFGFYINGECKQSYQHVRLREYPPTGGMSSCCEISYNDEIEHFSKILLKELNWTGVAMVEYKMDYKGNAYLMEINPKFWGSHDLAIYSGINFPELIVNYLSEGIVNVRKEVYKKRFHWPLHGDLQHALMKPKNLLKFTKDLVNKDVGSNLNYNDDLKGTIGTYINLFQKSIRRISGK